MFEKCEQATENPDILLHHSSKETAWDYNNNTMNSSNSINANTSQANRSNNYKQHDKAFGSISAMRHPGEKLSLDQEIKYFLKENEHTLLDQNLKNLLKTTQNEQMLQINSVLDEMVNKIPRLV